MVFHQFSLQYCRHSQTGQLIEAPLTGLLLCTDTTERNRKVGKATAVICKTLLLAPQKFHRLDGLQRLRQMYLDFASRKTGEETGITEAAARHCLIYTDLSTRPCFCTEVPMRLFLISSFRWERIPHQIRKI